MNINWKEVSQCPGYKSMKAAVADEAKRTIKFGRKPDHRYQKAFEFAINRAKHYAHRKFCSLQYILNDWEEHRSYNFISYYSDHNFPKLHNNKLKPMGKKGLYKLYDHQFFSRDPKRRREQRQRVIRSIQLGKSTKKKARWSMTRKKRGY